MPSFHNQLWRLTKLPGCQLQGQVPRCRHYWCMVQQELEELRKKAPTGPSQGPKVVAGTLLALRSIKVASVTPENLQQIPNRFPFADRFILADGFEASSAEVVRALAGMMTEDRLHRIQEVSANRAFSIVPVLEGLSDRGNLGAICRTADEGWGCRLGIWDRTSCWPRVRLSRSLIPAMPCHHLCSTLLEKESFHCICLVIGKRYRAGRGRTSAGAEKWLNMVAWQSSGECVRSLQASGFKVVVTAPAGPSAVPCQQWDWRIPTAVVLGNEQEGGVRRGQGTCRCCNHYSNGSGLCAVLQCLRGSSIADVRGSSFPSTLAWPTC
eukprot:jgi/Botrbrau1/20440/Bobra.145_2s0005.1